MEYCRSGKIYRRYLHDPSSSVLYSLLLSNLLNFFLSFFSSFLSSFLTHLFIYSLFPYFFLSFLVPFIFIALSDSVPVIPTSCILSVHHLTSSFFTSCPHLISFYLTTPCLASFYFILFHILSSPTHPFVQYILSPRVERINALCIIGLDLDARKLGEEADK